jgi:hypothetical protein
MTLEELSQYDGRGADKRVCVGVLGKGQSHINNVNNLITSFILNLF